MAHARRFYVPVTILALALLLAACGRMQAGRQPENPKFTIDLTVKPNPAGAGEAQLLVSLTDSAGNAVEGARIHVEGNMAHAGMRPVFADGSNEQGGRYVLPIALTMSGDWLLDVTATMPSGELAHRQFPVRVGG